MHMNFYKTTNPDDYGLYFYKQIGLNCTFEQPHEQIWTNPDVGTIHIYGSLDEIQCGTGDYTIPADLLAEFDYESAFLHFGIIYEGITYCSCAKFLTQILIFFDTNFSAFSGSILRKLICIFCVKINKNLYIKQHIFYNYFR